MVWLDAPDEVLVYRRGFVVPEAWAGKRVLLHFGAVDWHSEVWLNGRRVGEHRGGYDAFSFDVTAGQVLYKGRERLSGCWTLRPDGRVTIAWFDGGCWAVPASAFKEPRPL